MIRTFARRGFRSNSNQLRNKRSFFLRLEELEAREMLTATPLVVGPDAGGQPRIKVYNAATGGLLLNFLAFESSFTGGVRVATGDVTGDGVADIIAGKGPGGGSQVRVFNGVSGSALSRVLGNTWACPGGSSTRGEVVA